MSRHKMLGQSWGAVGHRLRSMAEMHQWSYPIASREVHRAIVLEHQNEEGDLMVTTPDDGEKTPEEPPQDGEEIIDYCCGFPVWGKRVPIVRKHSLPLADPYIEDSSR